MRLSKRAEFPGEPMTAESRQRLGVRLRSAAEPPLFAHPGCGQSINSCESNCALLSSFPHRKIPLGEGRRRPGEAPDAAGTFARIDTSDSPRARRSKAALTARILRVVERLRCGVRAACRRFGRRTGAERFPIRGRWLRVAKRWLRSALPPQSRTLRASRAESMVHQGTRARRKMTEGESPEAPVDTSTEAYPVPSVVTPRSGRGIQPVRLEEDSIA